MNKKNYLFIGVFFVSLVGNILFLMPYAISYLHKDRTDYFTQTATDKEIIQAVVETSMNMKESQMIQQEFHGLFLDIKQMFKEKRNSNVINNYYKAYNYAGLSQYALKSRNETVTKFLQRAANEWIGKDGNLNYPLERIDQCPIGIMYLNLYEITGEAKYKRIADEIFEFLKSKRLKDNIITYRNGTRNLSDAVGMFVPFLMEYYLVTNDSLAMRIAEANLAHYQTYGIDKDRHIPFHGYDMETGIKLGSSNWGRGIGWYLLAISYCPQMNDSILSSNVEKLPYTQFPLSSETFDSSTALMFELYKQSSEKNRKLNLDFIRTHIRKNGFVSDCSGDTYSLNDYSHSFGNNELCNGLLLLLYSKYN